VFFFLCTSPRETFARGTYVVVVVVFLVGTMNTSAPLPSYGQIYEPVCSIKVCVCVHLFSLILTHFQIALVDRYAGRSRLGHTTDIVALLTKKSDDESTDYIQGVLVLAILVASILLFCFLLLLTCRCLGPRRVGSASGDAFLIQTSSKSAFPITPLLHKSTIWRFVFLTIASIFIVFSILAVTQGVSNLDTAIQTVNSNAQSIQLLARRAQDILRDVKALNAVEIRDLLVNELQTNTFCPAQAQGALDIVNQASQAIPLLTQLDDFQQLNVLDLQATAKDIEIQARRIGDETMRWDFTVGHGLLILWPYVVLPSILMTAVIFAGFDVEIPWFTTLVVWIVLPLFVLLVVLASLCASLTLVGVAMNADFCAANDGSIDTTILQVVQSYEVSVDSIEYRVARYYVSQCTVSDDPFVDLRAFLPDLQEGQDALEALLQQLDNPAALDELQSFCNREFTTLVSQMDDMVVLIQTLIASMQSTLDLSACETIVPIYTSIFYETTCEYSLQAVGWMFAGFLVVASAGLVLLATRASYLPNVFVTSMNVHCWNVSSHNPSKGTNLSETELQVTPSRSSSDEDDYGFEIARYRASAY